MVGWEGNFVLDMGLVGQFSSIHTCQSEVDITKSKFGVASDTKTKKGGRVYTQYRVLYTNLLGI